MVKSKRVTAIYSSHILFRLEQSGFLISFLLLMLDPADQSIYGTLGGISSTHEQNNCIYYAYSVMLSFIHSFIWMVWHVDSWENLLVETWDVVVTCSQFVISWKDLKGISKLDQIWRSMRVKLKWLCFRLCSSSWKPRRQFERLCWLAAHKWCGHEQCGDCRLWC